MKRATIIALTSAAALAIALAVVALTADRAVAQSPSGPRPFQIQRSFTFTASTFSEPWLSVPAGTMLVIEHLSANVAVPPGQKMLGINMFVTLGSGQPFTQHFAPLISQGSSQFSDFYTVSQPIRAHAGPSTTLFLSGIRNSSPATGQVSVSATITGRLVTCASPTDCRLP